LKVDYSEKIVQVATGQREWKDAMSDLDEAIKNYEVGSKDELHNQMYRMSNNTSECLSF
jgi:hypothetical protein